MQKHMTPDKYTRSGTYKLMCQDCDKGYIGQTERSFNERYKEHKHAFRTNSHSSNYTKHILEELHTFGPIDQTMQVLQYREKGTHLNTIERFFIYLSIHRHVWTIIWWEISTSQPFSRNLYSETSIDKTWWWPYKAKIMLFYFKS